MRLAAGTKSHRLAQRLLRLGLSESHVDKAGHLRRVRLWDTGTRCGIDWRVDV